MLTMALVLLPVQMRVRWRRSPRQSLAQGLAGAARRQIGVRGQALPWRCSREQPPQKPMRRSTAPALTVTLALPSVQIRVRGQAIPWRCSREQPLQMPMQQPTAPESAMALALPSVQVRVQGQAVPWRCSREQPLQ